MRRIIEIFTGTKKEDMTEEKNTAEEEFSNLVEEAVFQESDYFKCMKTRGKIKPEERFKNEVLDNPIPY